MQSHGAVANSMATQQLAGDASAFGSEAAFSFALTMFRQPMINVANEGAASATASEAPVKLYSQAVWMVQQMWKQVFVPMAILFLLPGAILTNLKGLLCAGIIDDHRDEDGMTPFSGIFRSLIAIFLIPATQVIVSWCSDIGNSVTYEVQRYIVPAPIINWEEEQTFNAPDKNADNHYPNPQGAKAGKMMEISEKGSKVEEQSGATIMMQMAVNLLAMALNMTILLLLAFQVLMMCYLYLMGPTEQPRFLPGRQALAHCSRTYSPTGLTQSSPFLCGGSGGALSFCACKHEYSGSLTWVSSTLTRSGR